MKKQKQRSPAKSSAASEVQHDATVHHLVELALDLTALEDYASLPDALKKKKSEFQKLIRKCLHQKKDSILAEALERTYDENSEAFALLRSSLEEASENIVFRRDGGPDVEVTAFVVPMFVRTTGGLRSEECFQDEEAFEALRQSFQAGGLESRHASVVLVSYAYHADEIDRIGYSRLSDMIGEAFDTMTRKKTFSAPAIAASMSGWPQNEFAPEDSVVELRFLLGFALKPVDDPFYQVPAKESAADRYFEARGQRFRQWTTDAAALVKRCLVTDGRAVEVDFLYQDLFFSGSATGIAEYAMLQMLSELQQALDARGIAPEATSAVIGPGETEDGTVLRVQLLAKADGAVVAWADKPIGMMQDMQSDADDACDALATIGVESFALARDFDADGQAVDVRPYRPRR